MSPLQSNDGRDLAIWHAVENVVDPTNGMMRKSERQDDYGARGHDDGSTQSENTTTYRWDLKNPTKELIQIAVTMTTDRRGMTA